MKTFTIKSKVYKITGERGDFYIGTDNAGTVKMIEKKDAVITETESLPILKVYAKKVKSTTGTAGMDAFNRKLKVALENETGRTGLSIEEMKSL